MATKRVTMAQALLGFLKNQYVERDGVESRFFEGAWGIFGHGIIAGFGQALQQNPDFPYYLCRNEQAAVHIATAFAKSRMRLSTFACISSIGPGATNMITGAATATINRIPVLLLPGDIFARRNVAPVLQQLECEQGQDTSVNDAFKPVSRYWDRINRPDQLPCSVVEAMRVLTSPAHTGAVTLALPQDVQSEAWDFPQEMFEKRVWHIPRALPEPVMLARAVEAIRAAKRPFIVAGGGVLYSQASAALASFAERTGIPVGETQAGKGSLPFDHPRNLGAVGVTGTPGANIAAREADLVIAIGTRLSDFTTASKTAFQNPRVRFINLNVAEFDAFKHAGLPLIADARVALEQLETALAGYSVDAAYSAAIGEWKARWEEETDRIFSLRHGPPISQGEVIGAVSRVARPEDVVINSAGSLPGDLHKLWRTRKPGGYHMEYGYSCMGYEIAGRARRQDGRPHPRGVRHGRRRLLPDDVLRNRHLRPGRLQAQHHRGRQPRLLEHRRPLARHRLGRLRHGLPLPHGERRPRRRLCPRRFRGALFRPRRARGPREDPGGARTRAGRDALPHHHHRRGHRGGQGEARARLRVMVGRAHLRGFRNRGHPPGARRIRAGGQEGAAPRDRRIEVITAMPQSEVLNYIGGEWRRPLSGAGLEVVNPATGEVLAVSPAGGQADVEAAVQAASAAFPEWRAVPPPERIQYLFRLKQLLEDHFDEIARIITTENGKTLAEARGELRRGVENVEVACGIPTLMQGYNLEDVARGIDELMFRQPLGVVAAITPFNFPAMIPLWFLPYAIACGNTFILKPSDRVPLSIARIVELIGQTGLPAGVVNLVNGGKTAVDALLDHPVVRAISFVGSTPVARYIYARASAGGKRVQCQGGAKNHVAVLPDADPETTTQIIADSAYGCAGQRCLAVSVAVTVGDAREWFRDSITRTAAAMKIGNGLAEGVQMGPVISQASRRRIEGLIAAGAAQGASAAVDGRGAGLDKGSFVGPTVLDGVPAASELAETEIFGPVLSLIHAADVDEAIAIISRNSYGNASSIFTSSGAAARKFRNLIPTGNVGVNIGVAAPMAYFPFSGWKGSFLGVLHAQGRDAVEFYTDKKVVIERWPKEWTRKF